MSYLGTMFFILTPFGFFCTENGTGLITGTVFLILGILCKWIGNGGLKDVTTSKQKVSPEEFWKIHFMQFLNNAKNTKGLCYSVNDAKKWADDVTRANGCVPPNDFRYEQIAKEMGIKTLKVEREEREKSRINALAVLAVVEDVRNQFLSTFKENQYSEKLTLNRLYNEMKKKIKYSTPTGVYISCVDIQPEGGKEVLLKKIPKEYAEELRVWEEELKKAWANKIREEVPWLLRK